MEATASRRRKVGIAGVILVAIIAILVLLLMRNCHPAATVQAPPFNYFVAKADELGNDPNRILLYVRDQVPTLDYRGNVKGALGSLWNGAASPEEKVLLADALLAAAGKAKQTTLDEVCPTRDKKLDGAGPIALIITHRVETAASPTVTPIYNGPAGPLVGDVHSVELAAGGKTRILIRAAGQTPVEITVPDDAQGESLVFDWASPFATGTARLSTVRELWHKGNRGHASAHADGDRHDFVVIPCAIGPYVRDKEPVILKQRGRESSIEAAAYLALLNFAMAGDAMLRQFEKKMNVIARRDEPRVLIWSRYNAQDLPGGFACGLDARIDRAGFSGERITAYRATQARSLLQSALAAQFLEQSSALPARSAFGVFGMLKGDAPAAAISRIAGIRATLQSLAEERSLESVATFSPGNDGTNGGGAKAPVEVRWTVDGFEVRSGSLSKDFAPALLAADQASPDSRSFVFKDINKAAVAVETCLLASDVTPRLSPGFVLDTQISRKLISLVQPRARFLMQWIDDTIRTEQQIRVLRLEDGLAYQWRVQTAVVPVAGIREIFPGALAGATSHNPWYRAGSSVQEDVTSFVLSRKVYDAIKGGKNIELRMLGAIGTKSDVPATRPVDFTDALSPGQPTSIEPTINGKPEKITILPATIRGKQLALLDDRAAPVGMAQGIKSVVTAVRCRLVDPRGQPITGARLSVATREQPTQTLATGGPTALDGICLLSPPDQADSFGKAVITVTFPDRSIQKVEVDLTAPGLSTVTVKAERPTAKLLYLCRNDRRQLEALKLPDEVKRHALRDLDAGHLVIIPSQEVPDGLGTSTAYYACDNQSGDVVGVMENGLCGAATWEFGTASQAAATEEPDGTAAEPLAPSWQSGLAAWNSVEKSRPVEIAKDFDRQTLQSLRTWADATDVEGTFAQSADAGLAERLATVLKSPVLNTAGTAARPAFQIGYVTTINYLAQALENANGK